MADRERKSTKQPSVEPDDGALLQPTLEPVDCPSSSRTDSHGSVTATGFERKTSLPNLRRQATLPRRRSSNVSDFSTRSFMRESADSLLRPRPTNAKAKEDGTHWHSIPLAFAILPAVGGLFFENGSAFVTDVFLLGLGALFLNWSVRMPWEWYQSAQATVTIKPEVEQPSNTILEESDEDDAAVLSDSEMADSYRRDKPAVNGESAEAESSRDITARDNAAAQLRRLESLALLACFIGPLLGAYLLHAIRSQLTRPSEGLVSNFNLTIFVLAAELRPFSHLITLVQARTLHLQRVVEINTSDIDRVQSEQISEAHQRIEELEARIEERVTAENARPSLEGSTLEVSQAVRQSVQPQLDALNRAVRRYEKRATTQTIQYEARLQDLEARLRDALALAAIAADRSQKPGVLLVALEGASTLFMLPFQAAWGLFVWPIGVGTNLLMSTKVWLVGGRVTRPKPRQRRSKEGSDHFRTGQRPLAKAARR